ncbi:MAG: zinc ABC transporter substrate-binding protein [Candidatus Schekmanbacteria bacterium]|nr:zinc ABC transporter substrate-binding protein [Candidatus Schekmanbacteria bacterium]
MIVLAGALALACALACGDHGPRRALRVATSLPPHRWLIERIAGDGAEVASLLGPFDSHAAFQPTDVQVSWTMQAEVYFRAGVSFEQGRWFAALQSSAGLRIVDLRADIPLRHVGGHRHQGTADIEADDPHLWLSPKTAALQAENIARALGGLHADRAALYEQNLQALKRQLTALDDELRGRLAPFAGRAIFVYHPAWGYFADAYGLRQVAIEIEGKEPTDAELTRLQQQAGSERITVIFVQPQIAGQGARAVADAVGARLQRLDPQAPDIPENLRSACDAFVHSFSTE